MKQTTQQFGFLSIRNLILFFSLIITLIPVVGMGWFLNDMMESTVTEKCQQKLEHISTIIQRELSLWFKERKYDLYIFSNSFVITENYRESIRVAESGTLARGETPVSIRMVDTYLSSVQNQFEYYSHIVLCNSNGEVVATSQTVSSLEKFKLPEDYKKQLEKDKYFHSAVYFSENHGAPMMLIGTPLFNEKQDNYDGLLAIEVNLSKISDILHSALEGNAWESPPVASLLQLSDNRLFLSSEKTTTPEKAEIRINFDHPDSRLQEYINSSGEKTVGLLAPMKEFQWAILVSENYAEVYSQVLASRNRNFIIICLLGLAVGLLAWLLARQIIKPLQALTDAARQVAEGDLNVHLERSNNDELGLATHVFNDMVNELRESQAALMELATTDSLTSLANRKQIMTSLLSLYEHYKRYQSRFSILMLDIDHFKQVNDTYGHQAGDLVLAGIGEILRNNLRNIDAAGRYGGEEFLILLPESGKDDARRTAGRICDKISAVLFQTDKKVVRVTASIGIATISSEDKDEGDLVKRADAALYKAKESGRNKCVYLPPEEPSRETLKNSTE